MAITGWMERVLFPGAALNRDKLRREIQGKTILITGASSGIGEQAAYMLADSGAHLVLVARRAEKLEAMKAELEARGARVSVHPADLRNEEQLEGLIAYLRALPDGLDIIVSNAGHSIRRSIFESLDRYHDFARTMALHYSAPVRLLLAMIPVLERRQGHIIHISTINTLLIPFPYWAAYQASKAAFDTWFQAVMPELRARGIAATSIYLPLVRTPMIMPTAAYRKLPAMSPQQAARVIGRAICTRRKVWKPWWLIFGQLGSVLFRGSWERHVPRMLRKKGR